MNILLVDDILDVGGKERQFLTALEVLQKYDIDIHVALLKGKGVLGDRAIGLADGYMVCNRKHPLSLRTIRRIRKYVVQNKIDLIHCNGVIDSLHVYLAAKDLTVKLVCTVHGYEKGLHLRVHKHILSRYDAVVAVSKPFLGDIIKQGYRSNLFRVIPNSYSTEFISTELPSTNHEKNLRMVMVSRFDWSKDHTTVLRALKKLKEAGFGIELDFIGGGEEKYIRPVRETVSSLDLEDSVCFLGVVGNLSELLDGYDLMVMSSRAESFGIVLVEGMASGLPIVASDIDPFREITDEGRYGLLFRTGDHGDLADRITGLAESIEKRKEMSELSIERAADYSPETYGERTIGLYREVLDSENV